MALSQEKNKPLKEKMENLRKAQGSSARVVSSHHCWALHLTVQVKLQGRTLYQKNSRILKKKIGHCDWTRFSGEAVLWSGDGTSCATYLICLGQSHIVEVFTSMCRNL